MRYYKRAVFFLILVGALAMAAIGVTMSLSATPVGAAEPEPETIKRTYFQVDLGEIILHLSEDGEDGYWTAREVSND